MMSERAILDWFKHAKTTKLRSGLRPNVAQWLQSSLDFPNLLCWYYTQYSGARQNTVTTYLDYLPLKVDHQQDNAPARQAPHLQYKV